MSNRNWYCEGDAYPKGFWGRSIGYDTTIYREIAALREQEGTDDAILSGVVLLEIADAAKQWFATNPDEPYGDAPMLLSDEEIDIVSEAESQWYEIPGNTERQEELWHNEYLTRMGAAITSLTGAGFEASGEADRHRMIFRLLASHPNLQGDSGLERAYEVFHQKEDYDYGFGRYIDDSGLFVIYDACPPSGNFEPVIKKLTTIVSQ